MGQQLGIEGPSNSRRVRPRARGASCNLGGCGSLVEEAGGSWTPTAQPARPGLARVAAGGFGVVLRASGWVQGGVRATDTDQIKQFCSAPSRTAFAAWSPNGQLGRWDVNTPC